MAITSRFLLPSEPSHFTFFSFPKVVSADRIAWSRLILNHEYSKNVDVGAGSNAGWVWWWQSEFQ